MERHQVTMRVKLLLLLLMLLVPIGQNYKRLTTSIGKYYAISARYLYYYPFLTKSEHLTIM